MLRALLAWFFLGAVFVAAAPAQETTAPASGRVLKVLPHLLDLKGRNTLSPSLFDRDAYQARLREHPDEVSGIRYDVLWKAHSATGQTLKVRVELRGLFEGRVPRSKALETTLEGRASLRRWTGLKLTGDDYKQFGTITAWRATLWCGNTMLDEYRSFLW